MAGWQSGHAADCKSVYAGAIPASASIKKMYFFKIYLQLSFYIEYNFIPILGIIYNEDFSNGITREW